MRAMWLEGIRIEGDRLAAMPATYLDAPVPSLPDWTTERVIRHVGKVHRWVSGLLAAEHDADPDAVAQAAPSLPRGPACLDAYREALDAVVADLRDTDPDRDTASFVGPTQVRFWIRRQAHEVAVHRVDAADAVHAAGGPAPAALDPVVAADGVAEWVEVFAATRHAARGDTFGPDLVGRSFGFVATDVADAAWCLDLDIDSDSGRHGATWRADAAGADVTIAGPAADLLLTLWRRRPLETVTVDGDRHLAVTLLDAMRF